ncbi:MAG: hypothetical protein PHW62_05995 [Candidatus Ratteibacteria bacterium]|nr:hypothetical protein [Candidatus Ratteibacteria bacterium]
MIVIIDVVFCYQNNIKVLQFVSFFLAGKWYNEIDAKIKGESPESGEK